jgi:hypothetical protein
MGGKKHTQRGGNMLPHNPANIDINASDTNKFPLGAENYGQAPNMFSSNVNPANIVQGGGAGFGYTTGANTNIYAGSYAPIDRNCTGCEVGGRGGNNFMSGGKGWEKKGGKKHRTSKGGKNYTRKQKGCSSSRCRSGSKKQKRSAKTVKTAKKGRKGRKTRFISGLMRRSSSSAAARI